MRPPRYGLVFSPSFSMSLGGPSWPCGNQEAAESPHVGESGQWLVIPVLHPPHHHHLLKLPGTMLLLSYLQLPLSASAPHDKAQGRFMPLPGPAMNSGQQILTRDFPAGHHLLRPRLWLQDTAPLPGLQHSPAPKFTRLGAWRFWLMLCFWTDRGQFVANFPGELVSAEAGYLLSLSPWNAICRTRHLAH